MSQLSVDELRPGLYRAEELDGERRLAEHVVAGDDAVLVVDAGLPPTPIAMPGLASLRAAMRPGKTEAFYYVSRGDGSSQFSRTLDEHNRAVARYQLRRPAK